MPQRHNRWKRREWTNVRLDNTRLATRYCEVCKKRLERNNFGMKSQWVNGKQYFSQRWETLARFNSRRTCSKECKQVLIRGKNNPNYKGKMPKCEDCGKPVGYYAHSDKVSKRCRGCFIKWAHENKWYENTPQIKRLAEKMRQTAGTYPDKLKPYKFRKGQTPWNKGLQDN